MQISRFICNGNMEPPLLRMSLTSVWGSSLRVLVRERWDRGENDRRARLSRELGVTCCSLPWLGF